GSTDYEPSLGGKWVELLKEISPATTRMVVPFNGTTAPFARKFILSAEAAGVHLSVSLSVNDIRNIPELDRAIGAFAGSPNGGLVVIPDALNGQFNCPASTICLPFTRIRFVREQVVSRHTTMTQLTCIAAELDILTEFSVEQSRQISRCNRPGNLT